MPARESSIAHHRFAVPRAAACCCVSTPAWSIIRGWGVRPMPETSADLRRSLDAVQRADIDRALRHIRAARAACAEDWVPRDAVLDALLLAILDEARDPATAIVVAATLSKAAQLLSLLSSSAADTPPH